MGGDLWRKFPLCVTEFEKGKFQNKLFMLRKHMCWKAESTAGKGSCKHFLREFSPNLFAQKSNLVFRRVHCRRA